MASIPTVQKMDIHKDIQNMYKESNWGKLIDGQFVIDGYKFRGRQSFTKAKEGLKDSFTKGSQHEIEGIKFRILDARQKGVENEIELEVEDNIKNGIENRGMAIVKLYGPNKRKECVVTVTKSKDSDVIFVQIIAQMVVKPYLNKFLTSENLGQLMDIDIQSDLHKKIICNKCEKIFDTTQGLKIHMSKMHVQQSRSLSKRTLEVYVTNNETIMKNHKKEKHGKLDTSPPQKKQRSESDVVGDNKGTAEDMGCVAEIVEKIAIKKQSGKSSKIPNIIEVPNNIKHLVNENDKIYRVPGDGACAPNCASAYLFQDEIFGPKLRRQMNIFMACHWDERYNLICPCTPDTPFIRKLRGKLIKFTDPAKLK